MCDGKLAGIFAIFGAEGFVEVGVAAEPAFQRNGLQRKVGVAHQPLSLFQTKKRQAAVGRGLIPAAENAD